MESSRGFLLTFRLLLGWLSERPSIQNPSQGIENKNKSLLSLTKVVGKGKPNRDLSGSTSGAYWAIWPAHSPSRGSKGLSHPSPCSTAGALACSLTCQQQQQWTWPFQPPCHSPGPLSVLLTTAARAKSLLYYSLPCSPPPHGRKIARPSSFWYPLLQGCPRLATGPGKHLLFLRMPSTGIDWELRVAPE